MQGVLTFASLSLGLVITLLFGLQWGVVTSLLAFYAVSNFILHRSLNKLQAHVDQIINELPELLKDLAICSEPVHHSGWSFGGGDTPKSSNPIEQRILSLEHKLDLLLQHSQDRVYEEQGPSCSSSSLEAPTKTETLKAYDSQLALRSTRLSAQDLNLIEELLDRMNELLAALNIINREPAGRSPNSETTSNTESTASSHRPLIDELYRDLDQVAQKMRIELSRLRM